MIQNKFDSPNDRVDILLHLPIPKAEHSVADRFQIAGALCVIFLLLWFKVVTSIQFDDQFLFDGDEVDNVFADGVLSAKVYAV